MSKPLSMAEIDEAANWQRILALLDEALDISSVMPDGRRALSEALCAALEHTNAGYPDSTLMMNIRDDARWWADLASPIELEAYTGAALRRIERATFANAARKRVFTILWKSFTDKERANFIKKVHPP